MIYLTNLRNEDLLFKHHDAEFVLNNYRSSHIFLSNTCKLNGFLYDLKETKRDRKNINSYLSCLHENRHIFYNEYNTPQNDDNINQQGNKRKLQYNNNFNNYNPNFTGLYKEKPNCDYIRNHKIVKSNAIYNKIKIKKNIANKFKKNIKHIILRNKRKFSQKYIISNKLNTLMLYSLIFPYTKQNEINKLYKIGMNQPNLFYLKEKIKQGVKYDFNQCIYNDYLLNTLFNSLLYNDEYIKYIQKNNFRECDSVKNTEYIQFQRKIMIAIKRQNKKKQCNILYKRIYINKIPNNVEEYIKLLQHIIVLYFFIICHVNYIMYLKIIIRLYIYFFNFINPVSHVNFDDTSYRFKIKMNYNKNILGVKKPEYVNVFIYQLHEFCSKIYAINNIIYIIFLNKICYIPNTGYKKSGPLYIIINLPFYLSTEIQEIIILVILNKILLRDNVNNNKLSSYINSYEINKTYFMIFNICRIINISYDYPYLCIIHVNPLFQICLNNSTHDIKYFHGLISFISKYNNIHALLTICHIIKRCALKNIKLFSRHMLLSKTNFFNFRINLHYTYSTEYIYEYIIVLYLEKVLITLLTSNLRNILFQTIIPDLERYTNEKTQIIILYINSKLSKKIENYCKYELVKIHLISNNICFRHKNVINYLDYNVYNQFLYYLLNLKIYFTLFECFKSFQNHIFNIKLVEKKEKGIHTKIILRKLLKISKNYKKTKHHIIYKYLLFCIYFFKVIKSNSFSFVDGTKKYTALEFLYPLFVVMKYLYQFLHIKNILYLTEKCFYLFLNNKISHRIFYYTIIKHICFQNYNMENVVLYKILNVCIYQFCFLSNILIKLLKNIIMFRDEKNDIHMMIMGGSNFHQENVFFCTQCNNTNMIKKLMCANNLEYFYILKKKKIINIAKHSETNNIITTIDKCITIKFNHDKTCINCVFYFFPKISRKSCEIYMHIYNMFLKPQINKNNFYKYVDILNNNNNQNSFDYRENNNVTCSNNNEKESNHNTKHKEYSKKEERHTHKNNNNNNRSNNYERSNEGNIGNGNRNNDDNNDGEKGKDNNKGAKKGDSCRKKKKKKKINNNKVNYSICKNNNNKKLKTKKVVALKSKSNTQRKTKSTKINHMHKRNETPMDYDKIKIGNVVNVDNSINAKKTLIGNQNEEDNKKNIMAKAVPKDNPRIFSENEKDNITTNCNPLNQYLNHLKNINYDIKFGNAYIKLRKKLSLQNKCQFEIYEGEIVAVDNICNMFCPYVQNFEKFYHLLKRNINNYDFLQSKILETKDIKDIDINEDNINDFIQTSKDYDLIINYLINNNFLMNQNLKSGFENGNNYIFPTNTSTIKSMVEDYIYPLSEGTQKNSIERDNSFQTYNNDSINLKRQKISISNSPLEKSPDNSTHRDNSISCINNNNRNIIFQDKNKDNIVNNDNTINSNNMHNSIIINIEKKKMSNEDNNVPLNTCIRNASKRNFHNVAPNKQMYNENRNILVKKNSNITYSIIKKEENRINSKQNINNNSSCSSKTKLLCNNIHTISGHYTRSNKEETDYEIIPNNYDNEKDDKCSNKESIENFNGNKEDPISLLLKREILYKHLINEVKKIRLLKQFGYKSLYDILKERFKEYMQTSMNVESRIIYNIIKHICKYININEVINNPFYIYQNSIKNIPNNKFAIKILNINACNIHKLKYKIHSLLSEGKQLKNVNMEITNYKSKKKNEQNIYLTHEENLISYEINKKKNLIFSKNDYDFDIMLNTHCNSHFPNGKQVYLSKKNPIIGNNVYSHNSIPKIIDINKTKLYTKSSSNYIGNANNENDPNILLSNENFITNEKYQTKIMGQNSLKNHEKNIHHINIMNNNMNHNNSKAIINAINIDISNIDGNFNSINNQINYTNLSQDNDTSIENNNCFYFGCKNCLNIYYNNRIINTGELNQEAFDNHMLNSHEKMCNGNIINENGIQESLRTKDMTISNNSKMEKNNKKIKSQNKLKIVNMNNVGKKKMEKKDTQETNTNRNRVSSNKNINCTKLGNNSKKNNVIKKESNNTSKNVKESQLKLKSIIITQKTSKQTNIHTNILKTEDKEIYEKNKNNYIQDDTKDKFVNEKKQMEGKKKKLKNAISKNALPYSNLESALQKETSPFNSGTKNENYLELKKSSNDCYIPHNSLKLNINNFKNIELKVCKNCEKKNLENENSLTKIKKNKKCIYMNAIPKFLWSSVGITKNNEHVLGVAMQMIEGCTLTYIIQKLKGTENINYGLFLLDICKKLVKRLMMISESIDNPIINWDTKPGNIMVEYKLSKSKIICKNVTIIDIGDALPGRCFFFPTNPSYYEKIKINNANNNFNFLYYVICTKGYCSPECALLVFLLSSLNKSDQFRKTWYGPDSNIYHINKTKQLRIKHRWKKLLDLRFIQPIVKRKEITDCENSLNTIIRNCNCATGTSGDNTTSYLNENNHIDLREIHLSYEQNKNITDHNNNDNTHISNHSTNGTSKCNSKKNSDSSITNIKTDFSEKNDLNTYIMSTNKSTYLAGYMNTDFNNNNNHDDKEYISLREHTNGNNMLSRRKIYLPNNIYDKKNKLHLEYPMKGMDENKLEHKNSNEYQNDILKNYYLHNVCTHDIPDDNLKTEYIDNDEIMDYLSNKDYLLKKMETDLSNCDRKTRKKKEYDYFEMHSVDTWVIKFTTQTTIFSVGLVLCQLFGGQNLLTVANKNEVKVVDLLCEWNCKNSTNIYSGEKNITINDLLPNKGIFSNDIWKKKVAKIIKKCLHFIPSRRYSFQQLYKELKILKKEYETYYNLKDS
ncbi:conserved protein, unknown function [Plasmodium yoelii]|uniref:Uncharacterized protein n=2 Tax=Plasmodium yoelii TaxID=5861 RepID=A0AAE9WKV7_PLAYO|nr:conserved protein, unknown function [Plasmodium yoelii]WBY55436.1 hypothetical protein Py17XNL_000404028 [Plasmodium yoelii yoelii]VTZ73510.1 conserved protein, unknown function [Plasmodium yoelii]|eukprot:XP_022811599.1 conserved protein, unknown function [Plasmodium yoelii]